MRAEHIKKRLQEKATEIGIDKIGFTSADPFLALRERLIESQEKGYASGFEEPDIEKRVNPELTFPQAKSIIAIALAYPSRLIDAPVSEQGGYRGIFARASWGEDYHIILKQKLQELENYLKELVPHVRVQSMVDTGVLSDRAVAERAGIGWSGKNTAVITEEFGSWVYLGEMITDIYLPSDEPILDQCGDCNRCIDVCPTGALVQPGQLDAQSCIAFLTQTKGFLPEQYRKKLGNRLYGCDTCQTVCPKNRRLHFDHHEQMKPEPEWVKPLLKPLLNMSNRQFKERFGKMSGSWRGKKPIQRNAIIALAHFKDESAIPLLTELLQRDPRPVIRGTSAWALVQIGGDHVEQILRDARSNEDDAEVVSEIDAGLNILLD
ncbi:tRNA epoxyqueuosine(34) reductase QueG [Hazenella sp. IB182353]|uniref:tRNA epoxyqueuosine(34) reductase QueG n=1 Tax=Polycladospora coralii TaxID=2771432 RepID=UPI0017472E92|nr:tRNA epoxyqueuosine(34) reductase QueG [Polycladospora coralii]MBS7529604.1 tRNA epoxyqueuosine(34) reductase QueG [Polycladospora coralii]